ncbi:MAG: hypothetical protein Q4C42_11445 [Clostridia bacterium]|nr:hypothetical protein [Clostridia bacterium]
MTNHEIIEEIQKLAEYRCDKVCDHAGQCEGCEMDIAVSAVIKKSKNAANTRRKTAI